MRRRTHLREDHNLAPKQRSARASGGERGTKERRARVAQSSGHLSSGFVISIGTNEWHTAITILLALAPRGCYTDEAVVWTGWLA